MNDFFIKIFIFYEHIPRYIKMSKIPQFKDYSNKHRSFKENLDENGKWKKINTVNNTNINNNNNNTNNFNKKNNSIIHKEDNDKIWKRTLYNNDKDSDILKPSNNLLTINNFLPKEIQNNNDNLNNIKIENEENIIKKDNIILNNSEKNIIIENSEQNELKGYWKFKKENQNMNTFSHQENDYQSALLRTHSELPRVITTNNYRKSLPTPNCFRDGNYSFVFNTIYIKFNIDENNNLDEESINNFYLENSNNSEKLDLTKIFDNTSFQYVDDYIKNLGCVSNAYKVNIFKTYDGLKYTFYTRHCYPFRYFDKLIKKYSNLNFYIKSYNLTNRINYEDVVYQNGNKFNI